MATDSWGPARCARCGSAFEYEVDERATATWRASGRRGFVCRSCADVVLGVLGTDDEGTDDEEPYLDDDYPRD